MPSMPEEKTKKRVMIVEDENDVAELARLAIESDDIEVFTAFDGLSALDDIPHIRPDLVLVDAPCSGTGTWRRNPELRWRLTPERLARLTSVQARLIDLAAGLLKPGGRLVYAVCSVLPSEGADQAAAAAGRLGLVLADQRALSPLADGCDGFFVARLDKPR